MPRLGGGGVRLGGPSPPQTPRTAGVSDDVIADGMIPPGLGPTTAPARPPVLVLCDRCCGIRLTGKPPRLHMRAVRHEGFGFFGLRRAIGLGLLLCQLTRMHHDKAHFLLGDPPIAVLHLDVADDALPMPAAGRPLLPPARVFFKEGGGGVLASPSLEI